MAWIESHQALRTHPKVIDLGARMGWTLDTTLGKLHRFWWWCLDYAEDGDLRKHNDDQIASSAGVLPGKEAKVFVRAMVSARWLDRQPYFRVHDWWDYIGMFLQRKYGNRNTEKWKRVQQLYNTCTASEQSAVQQFVAPTNQPTLTNQPKDIKTAASAAACQAFMARTTELLKGKGVNGADLQTVLRACYGQVVALLKAHPDRLEPLMEEVAGLPVGMQPDWYRQALRGKVQRLRPTPGISTVNAVLTAAGRVAG